MNQTLLTNSQTLQHHFERLKANKLFELFVISVILVSALLIGAKTYPLPAKVVTATVVLDYLITLFFVVEISIRFIAEANKKLFFKRFLDLLIGVVGLIVFSPFFIITSFEE